jgi:hypothetical protein
MSKDEEYFTVVFMGNVKKLEGNPFWFESDFGVPISIAAGHALEELDELRDAQPPAHHETPETKGASQS